MKTKTSLHFFFSLCLLSLCSFIWGGNLLSAQTTKSEEIELSTGSPSGSGNSLTITWEGTSCTILQEKGNSSSAVNSSYIAAPRWYAGHKISFTAKTGYKLTGAVIECSSESNNKYNKLGSATYTNATVQSDGNTYTITSTGDFTIQLGAQSRITSLTILYEVVSEGGGGTTKPQQNLAFADDAKEVYSDAIGNKFTNVLTGAEGAVTYSCNNDAVATVDANSGEVTIKGIGKATITATAAAATVDGTEYAGTTKSYTLNVWPTTIAELKSIITSSEATFKAKLTGAYITYVPDASNAYLQDASGAILIYKSGHGLNAGNCYTGEISGSTVKFHALNEIKDFDFSKATQTTKSDIAAEEVSLAELSTNFAHYESKYIKVTEVTVSSAVQSKGNESELTQGGTKYSSPVLRAAAKLTDGITAGTTYPAIIVFPSYYDAKEQLNLWSDDLVTLPAGTLKTPDVAFGAAAYEVAINEAIELPFTTDSDGDVTYTATPSENITLTKTANGVSVTATATGTFNITANVAETANFAAGSTSTTLTVTPPASNLQNVVLYKKVTSTDALIDGAQYLVVCESKNKALVAGTSNIHNSTPADVTTADGKISSETVASGDVAVFTLGTVVSGTSTHYTLKIGDKFVTGADGTGLSLGSNNTTKAAHWTVAFNNKNVEITNVSYSTRGIMYSTSDAFKHYAISQRGDANFPAIQLYQKVGELKAHRVMGGYASYAADFAYIMPEGLMGKIVYLDGNKLTTDNIYAGGTEVPALTPLLIRTYEAFSGTDALTYYPIVLNKEVAKNDATDKNALEYRRDIVEGKYMTSSLNFAEGCRYYKLSVDNEGLNPGFYYGAADGAAFEMKNGSSAYLTVSASLASPALLFDDNEITGIENLTPAQGAANNGAVYNLQGVRMNGKNLQKGLYIINGKKVVIK